MQVADHCNYNSSGVVLRIGGNYNQNQNYGMFYLNGNNDASNQNSNIGSRHLVKTVTIDFLAQAFAHLLVKILP